MDNLKTYQKPSKPAKPKTVLVFGTFDILHPGHLNFFDQARKAGGEGSKLVVVVARDFNSKKAKGIFPLNNERARLDAVKKSNSAD
ncbi:MAG: adenylyltransferase/cytidyltransferase family protein, partial [Candidatus Woesearchaeota archaeon]|nr:adenylyltransferase/cytidyltransferase family protein [Candidatus Woesearchaeota archaeon]